MHIALAKLTLVAALAALSVTPLPAQSGPRRAAVPVSLLTIALHDLKFTGVLQGIPKTVSPLDAENAALFEIQGLPNASIRMELVLPTALIGDGGGVLPVDFGASDGFADYTRGQSALGRLFNPRAPLINTLSTDGKTFVRLGGTVHPGRPQPGGEYRALIVLTVYNLGT